MQVSTLTVAPPADVEPRRDECVVETVTDPNVFVRLEREWNDAVDRAGITHPFLCHEWIRTWWECFGGDCELHLLVVWSAGRVIAIAPLMLEKARMYGVPVRRLRLLQNDHSPRADFIIADRPDDAYRAIWSALFCERHNWDVLQLSQLPAESPTLGLVSGLAEADGCPTGVWQSGSSPYLVVTGTETDYFSSLSAKFRQNVRNRIARLRRTAEPTLEIVAGRDVAAALPDAVRLEESGWKRRAGTAICTSSTIQRFYSCLAERMTTRGWLRLHFLTVQGRRIATSYSLAAGKRLYLCKTGYDPAYETCSPFKVLMHFLVRHAFAEGLAEIDLLGDPEPWKLEWTQTSRAHNWLFVFSDTNRGRLLYPVKFQLIPAVKRSGVAGLVGR
jgi:CelD/BcsL family acetyltransferase involved in cellulose biosynthesis